MKDLERLSRLMRDSELEPWLECLEQQVSQALSVQSNAKLAEWKLVLEQLPEIENSAVHLDRDVVSVEPAAPLSDLQKQQLEEQLKKLMPWRKGPYQVHGVYIDTEWRSDFKWERLRHSIRPLSGKRILDVGCGNGYHGWRMMAMGADLVIGVDPSPLFAMQFAAMKHFIGEQDIFLLPVGIEAVPENLRAFDTVFSMGVFYHRRSPIDHLYQLRQCLKPGGQLVLETLVIEGNDQQVLMPVDRYAQMRNVWFIPSSQAMIKWLERCGFKNVQLVDESFTEFEEQRSTEWMQFHSLREFLDADDKRKTIEGYPAPLRAIFIADAP